MAQQYAKDQPSGYNNYIKNVAIIGAGGQMGKFIVSALQKTGKHNVTAVTRAGSASDIPSGLTVKHINYDDHSSIVTALQGQDALVITLGVFAPPDTQAKLFKAAAEAKVPWILPNEWGMGYENEELSRDIIIGVQKHKEHALIEELGLSWVGVACSFWYEFSLSGTKDRYGFDFDKKEVLWFGDGNVKLSTSTWELTAKATAALLGLKILPEDENDKSATLTEFRNRVAYVRSFTLTQRDMFASILRVTGDKESDWKQSSVDVKQYYADSLKEMQNGDRAAFGRVLYGRMFYPEEPGNFEKIRVDNERLGLTEKEDLDERTKIAVKMAEEGYIQKQYQQSS